MSAALNMDKRPNLKQVFNVSSKEKFKPANKNKRFIAFLIDGIISGITGKLLVLPVAMFTANEMLIKGAELVIPFLFLPIIYWTFLTIHFGATPGKKMFGLKIVHHKTHKDLTFGKLMFRETIGRTVNIATLLVGYAWVAWNKESRGLHDLISETIVVDNK